MAKKIPLRQCVGCGEMKGKKEMMRDFTSLELAVDWFRRIVAEDKDLLLHNRERLK